VAVTDTASFTENALAFFDAVETGKGWEACSAYCDRDATFEAQADALADVHTLRDYAEWMKGMLAVLPDARYELKSFAVDAEHQNIAASTARTAATAGQCRRPARARAPTTST
jgi:hypothetical protein